jgi:hypothetical protein
VNKNNINAPAKQIRSIQQFGNLICENVFNFFRKMAEESFATCVFRTEGFSSVTSRDIGLQVKELCVT